MRTAGEKGTAHLRTLCHSDAANKRKPGLRPWLLFVMGSLRPVLSSGCPHPIGSGPASIHNILCLTKKTAAFFTKFSLRLPLSPVESCAIMSLISEICEEKSPMITDSLKLSQNDVRKLLSAASPDAALLYIYLQCGNRQEDAEADLHLNASRLSCAGATLRQLGLAPEDRPCRIAPGERPSYSERDVLEAMDTDASFRSLYGEVQRLLGRSLNTEELKILLGFVRYLGLPSDVISVLVCYCKDRARQRGSLRNPSLRTIEKEAYAWAERGIDTVEEAAAFIQAQNVRNSRLHRLMNILQIHGRSLTAAEERYAQSWLDMGADEEMISMAYERTCLNTGGLNWAYMNKILQRWNEQGFRTAEEVRSGDRKVSVPKGASGQLGEAELEAIQRVLREG